MTTAPITKTLKEVYVGAATLLAPVAKCEFGARALTKNYSPGRIIWQPIDDVRWENKLGSPRPTGTQQLVQLHTTVRVHIIGKDYDHAVLLRRCLATVLSEVCNWVLWPRANYIEPGVDTRDYCIEQDIIIPTAITWLDLASIATGTPIDRVLVDADVDEWDYVGQMPADGNIEIE